MISEKIRGRIVSDKLTKTKTVLVQRQKMHPIYKKSFKVSKRYLVHDTVGAKIGDIVDVVKIRPVSKNKHWKILSVVGKDIEAIAGEELKQGAAEAIAQVMPEEGKGESGKGEELKTEVSKNLDDKTNKRKKRKENKQEEKEVK